MRARGSNPSPAARRRAGQRAAALPAAALTLLAAGCAELNYARIRIGQGPREYERALPAEHTRRTHLGLCSLTSDPFGRTDATVVLLTPDRRVAAKLQATRFVRRYGFTTGQGFLLRGELSPALAELEATGPIDALRLIAGDLAGYQGERLAMRAYAWVAGGLARLIRCWPHVRDVGVEAQRLNDLYELVPGGGAARLAVDRAGIYHFEYRQGQAR